MDAQSVINWAVVGQLSWQYFRAPTLDHCSLSRWSSSSVYSTNLSRGSISDSWYTCYCCRSAARVANHVQFQVADDPANHSAISDRPIGRYRRLSSLSAQAHQTKNRCRTNLRFGSGILLPNSHRRDKLFCCVKLSGSVNLALNVSHRSMTIKIWMSCRQSSTYFVALWNRSRRQDGTMSEAVANFLEFQKVEGTPYSDDSNIIVHSPSVSSELPLEFANTPRGRKKELIFFCVRLF